MGSGLLVIASDRHRGHAPLAEIESSGLQPPFEHPGRADAINATLAADARFSIVEPTAWATSAIDAVHDPDLARFLERAWGDYQVGHPGTHDVVPDVFAMPGLVDGIGAFPDGSPVDQELGRWCFETTTPITEGTYDAARSAVDIALSATDAVLKGEQSAYGLCRPPGHHAAGDMFGGYCFINNAAVAAQAFLDQGASRVALLDVDFHHGNGSQAIFYDRSDVMFLEVSEQLTAMAGGALGGFEQLLATQCVRA